MPYHNCTEVTPACPVELTTYGYRPAMGANAFFAAVFGLLLIGQIVLGIRGRTWSFMVAVGIGCFGEMVGYIGRIIMHSNPWSQAGFETQICCLVLAPSFLAAGIYLSLKHLTRHYGPEHSRLRPQAYTWLFVGCDLFSILLQATGGGIASARKPHLLKIGDDLIIAGISFQVVTMAVCGLLGLEYFLRLRKSRRGGPRELSSSLGQQQEPGKSEASSHEQEQEKTEISPDEKRTRLYAIAATVAFMTIFVRCVYRIPEMSGGWGSPLMRKEDEFLVLDGAMVAIGSLALTVFHPAIFFPPMGKQRA